MDILNNSIVTDADTEVLDSQITQISNDFSETYYFDSEQEEELELLVAKAMKLGELYERKKWQAAKAQAVLEVKPSRHVTLTCAQLREAFMFGAPDNDDQEQLETEMTIQWSDEGHSGAGYYCYYADYPEEGAIKLGEAQEQAND